MENEKIEVGEIIESEIVAVGNGGDRIIKKEGFVIFVPTEKAKGEQVKAEVTNVKKNFAFAKEVKDG